MIIAVFLIFIFLIVILKKSSANETGSDVVVVASFTLFLYIGLSSGFLLSFLLCPVPV